MLYSQINLLLKISHSSYNSLAKLTLNDSTPSIQSCKSGIRHPQSGSNLMFQPFFSLLLDRSHPFSLDWSTYCLPKLADYCQAPVPCLPKLKCLKSFSSPISILFILYGQVPPGTLNSKLVICCLRTWRVTAVLFLHIILTMWPLLHYSKLLSGNDWVIVFSFSFRL